jgi:hypothetical protein
VGPVPDPLLFFSCSAGNRTRASGSVAKNCDHWTTDAVYLREIGYGKGNWMELDRNYGSRGPTSSHFADRELFVLSIDELKQYICYVLRD